MQRGNMENQIVSASEEAILHHMRIIQSIKAERDQMKELIRKIEIDVASKDHKSATYHLKKYGYLKGQA